MDARKKAKTLENLKAQKKEHEQKAVKAAEKHQSKVHDCEAAIEVLEEEIAEERKDLILANVDFLLALLDECDETGRECVEHGPCTTCQLVFLKKHGFWMHECMDLVIDVRC